MCVCMFSSRPGRPPKRSSAYQADDYSDQKRLKLASNLFLRSFSDYKYSLPSNSDYISIPSLTNFSLFNSSQYHCNPTRPPVSTPVHQSTSSSKSEQCELLSQSISISSFQSDRPKVMVSFFTFINIDMQNKFNHVRKKIPFSYAYSFSFQFYILKDFN